MVSRTLVLEDFIPYRLSIASNLVSGSIAQTYQALFGISVAEWRVLAWVAEVEPVTQGAIGTGTRMDKVTVSRAAIALTARGLIGRSANPADRRSHMLGLTAEGRALYAAVAPKALDLEARIFDRFEPAEVAAFVAMLRRIEQAVLDLPESGRGA